jgi:hypothetical protein
VNPVKFGKTLKKFLGDIRATDKFHVISDPATEAKGVLTLSNPFQSVSHRQAYKGLAAMFARAFKARVKINEGTKSKTSMTFEVGNMKFVVKGEKARGQNVIRVFVTGKK